MNIIVPQTITRSMVIENTIPENATPWSPLTNYVEDALVVHDVTSTTNFPKVYQSLQGGNIGNTPTEENSLWWSEVSYSNKYALFDGTNSLQSISTGSCIIKIKPTVAINSIALVNSDIGQYSIKVYKSDNLLIPVYTKTEVLNKVNNWLQYIDFGAFVLNSEKSFIPPIIQDIKIKGSYEVHIELSPPENKPLKIGELIIGNTFNLGLTQRGIGTGVQDYSVKETDSFGNVLLVERAFTKRINCEILIKNTNLNSVQRMFYNLRAKSVLWIPTNDKNLSEATIIYGYYKSFSTVLSYPDYSVCSLEIEGLI